MNFENRKVSWINLKCKYDQSLNWMNKYQHIEVIIRPRYWLKSLHILVQKHSFFLIYTYTESAILLLGKIILSINFVAHVLGLNHMWLTTIKNLDLLLLDGFWKFAIKGNTSIKFILYSFFYNFRIDQIIVGRTNPAVIWVASIQCVLFV